MFWVPLALMAGAGAAKGMSNKSKDQRDAEDRAAIIRYSPWTGMSDPGRKERAGILSSTLQGAAMGAMMGQALGGPTAATGATGAAEAGGWSTAGGGESWWNKLLGTGRYTPQTMNDLSNAGGGILYRDPTRMA